MDYCNHHLTSASSVPEGTGSPVLLFTWQHLGLQAEFLLFLLSPCSPGAPGILPCGQSGSPPFSPVSGPRLGLWAAQGRKKLRDPLPGKWLGRRGKSPRPALFGGATGGGVTPGGQSGSSAVASARRSAAKAASFTPVPRSSATLPHGGSVRGLPGSQGMLQPPSSDLESGCTTGPPARLRVVPTALSHTIGRSSRSIWGPWRWAGSNLR